MKIDVAAVPVRYGTDYPSPHDAPCLGRERRALGNAAGLTQFGVNLLRLAPGVWSAQRHWHTAEDEFVYVLAGEVVLVETGAETVLRAGECAGFRAGVPDGHCLQNRSGAEALVLEVGTRAPETDACDYPDLDMIALAGETGYRRRDGTPYDSEEARPQAAV